MRFMVIACAITSAATLAVAVGAFVMPRAAQWARTASALKVHAVAVTGNRHVGRSEVLTAAGLAPGMYAGDVDAARVVAALRRIPWVKEAALHRSWLGSVSLRIVERAPVALVNVGTVHQVDREGVLLDIPAGSIIDLPLVSGVADTVIDGVRRLRAGDLRRLMRFIDEARSADPWFFQRLTQIDLTDPSAVRLVLQGVPAAVRLQNDGVGVRMKQLRTVLAALPSGGAHGVRAIDLRYANLAFVQTAEAGR